MNINVEWHKKNRLGVLKGSSQEKLQQRIKWHKEHLKYCACRADVPKSLKKYL